MALAGFFGISRRPDADASGEITTVPVAITEDEMRRRVDRTIDAAKETLDALSLRRLATLTEVGYVVTATAMKIPLDESARLVDALRWFTTEYRDLTEDTSLTILCINSPSANAVADARKRASAMLGIEITGLPRVVPNTVQGVSPSIEVSLNLAGNAIAMVGARLKAHIKLSAQMYCASRREAKLPVKQQVAVFFSELLVLATNDQTGGDRLAPRPKSAGHVDVVPVEPKTTGAGAEEALSIGAGVAEALGKRVALVRRKTGASNGPVTNQQHRALLDHMKGALKEGDPLDVAAIACILWDAGLSVKLSSAATRALDGGDGSMVEKPSPAKTSPLAIAPVPVQAAKSDEEEFLTTDELAAKIKYDARTIRDRLKDSVLLEGIHYVRPFGGRKTLYMWKAIQRDLGAGVGEALGHE